MSCDYGHAHEHGHHHGHSHGHDHGHHHEYHGGQHHHHEDHGHHGHHHGRGHGRFAAAGEQRPPTLKVKEGDVLACGCGDCHVELTVTKACQGNACGAGCEVAVSCCGEPMRRKAA